MDRAETSGKSRNGATGANDAAVAAALCSSAQRAAKNRGGRGGGRNSGWHGGGRSGGGGRALSRKDKDKYKCAAQILFLASSGCMILELV